MTLKLAIFIVSCIGLLTSTIALIYVVRSTRQVDKDQPEN